MFKNQFFSSHAPAAAFAVEEQAFRVITTMGLLKNLLASLVPNAESAVQNV